MNQELNAAAKSGGHLTSESGECRPHLEQELITVKEAARLYKICARSIYELIKSDPEFPYVNVGLKKKYMVDRMKFEEWLISRTRKEQNSNFKLQRPEELVKKGNHYARI